MIPRTLVPLVLLVTLGAEAKAADRPPIDAWLSTRAPALRSQGPVFVAATDPGRGAPSLVVASPSSSIARGTAEAAARAYLARHRSIYGIGPSALRGVRHRFTHDIGHGGKIVVLRQTVAGVDVFHGDLKVLLGRDHRLVAISGTPHPAAQAGGAQPFALDHEEAIVIGLRDLYGAPLGDPTLVRTRDHAGYARYELAGAESLRLRRPARVRPVYFPIGDALVPAYFVELQAQERAGAEVDVYQYVIAADDGRLLRRHDATAEEFSYRVHADFKGDQRPFDGPMSDFTPHPTGVPGEGPKPGPAANLVTLDGFNHNPKSAVDPWLPADATVTLGNNVDAYIDHNDPDGLNGNEFRAKVTAPGIFDWTYDLDAEPLANQAQSMAAIVDLFYVNNWLHDWWYDSGFDEAAGNAQMDNFERGGAGGDPLHAEAQDGALKGSRNNANMSTPVDGESPRMQMFLWSALSDTWVKVDPLGQQFAAGAAAFGPKNFDLSAALVLVDDGVGTTSDGCQAPQNDLVGKIALVDRGTCSFEIKAKNAEAAGAVGTLIANNADGNSPFSPGADPNTVDPTIPVQGISKPAGVALKDALGQSPQSAQMFRESGVERDGTLDNMVVAHEWGHFIHHRLVECGNTQCRGQSEGWGDFLALHTALRSGDDLTGAFPLSTYASAAIDPSGYFGIRRAPYSVDPTKNAMSFRHISNGEPLPQGHPLKAGGVNAEVHNAGEIWASMLWESYVALHQAYAGKKTFAEVQRLMSDYVVAGMIMTTSEPSFTEQRDGILLAIAAADLDDFQVVAEAFARRGAGTCAISPPKDSSDLVGVVEDFELSARGVITGVSMSDSLVSCDHDGVVDVDELGEIVVDLFNPGAAGLPAGSLLEIVDPHPALVFPSGSSTKLPAIKAQKAASAAFEVAVDEALVDATSLTLTVKLTTPAGCEEASEVILPVIIHGDLKAKSATVDDVEAPQSAWTIGGGDDAVWGRAPAIVDGYFWHADDVSRKSDTWLESPDLKVAAGKPFVIDFDHAYSFEYSDNTYWDGAVLEITKDGGDTWYDLSVFVDPGYVAPIKSEANPLDKRPAYVGKSPSYPERDHVSLDLGAAFEDEVVRIRFRVGTDAAAGDHGWDLDNLAFSGINNAPFPSWIPDQGICVEETGTDTDTDSDSGTGTESTDGTGTDGTGTDGTAGTAGTAGTDGTAGTAGTDGMSASASGSASATGGTGGTAGTASAGETADVGDDESATTGPGETVDDGCGCRSEGGGGGAIGLVIPVLLGLGRRRRR